MSKNKDKRYQAVKTMINSGDITGLKDIFEVLPLTVLHQDTGMNYSSLHKKIYKSNKLKVEDLILLAESFDVTPAEILRLSLADLKYTGPKKKASRQS